ncbi:MAG: transcriptional regulator [Clostridiales bacterium]|jgi:LacI family transcriptional regulator|nr:transcriptional regulator [Clostridiales bacterium]
MEVTIKDIAKQANVSIATVSRIINNKDEGFSLETKDRVKKIIKEMDYHPNSIARGLVTKKTSVIGLILPDITNPFFPEVVRGVEDTANAHGYNIILCNTDDDEKKEKTYFKILRDKYVDGVIYTSAAALKDKNIKILTDGEIPFVLMDRYIENQTIPYIHTDSERGMYEIVNYLISNGHKKISYISGPVGDVVAEQRKRGYKKALKESGIEYKELLVRHGNYKVNSGISCMESLMESGENFSAVVCANDLMAVGALEVLKVKGIRVPEDISITGYDDVFLSQITTPKLTTISQPKYDLGKISAEILIKLINGEDIDSREIKLEPHLVIRGSVAKRSEVHEDSSNR